MANDSLRTTLCVRYRAEVVACGILFTAARKLKVGAAPRLPATTWFVCAFVASFVVCFKTACPHPLRGFAADLSTLDCPPARILALLITFSAPYIPTPATLQVPMPESPPWWELFEVKEAEVFDVAAVLCHLYQQPRAQRLPLVPPPPGAPAPAAGASSKSPLTQVGGDCWLDSIWLWVAMIVNLK
jgi:hypothetical protein